MTAQRSRRLPTCRHCTVLVVFAGLFVAATLLATLAAIAAPCLARP